MGHVAPLIGSACVAAGIFMLVAAMNRRRRDALAAYAVKHGLTFTEDCPNRVRLVTELIPALNVGQNQSARFELRGTRGDEQFSAFEYQYSTGGGRSQHYRSWTVLLWRADNDNWPAFTLGPEGWWEKIKERFGATDIDFPEDPEFSRLFQLQGPDEKAVRGVFDAARCAFLKGRPGVHLAGNGPYLLSWTPVSFPSVKRLDTFFLDGDEIRQRFRT